MKLKLLIMFCVFYSINGEGGPTGGDNTGGGPTGGGSTGGGSPTGDETTITPETTMKPGVTGSPVTDNPPSVETDNPPLVIDEITGGQDVPEGYAPFQCSLQIHKNHICGCSIIHSRFVLTAASCVESRVTFDLAVMVGSYHIPYGDYYDVDEIIFHEKFNNPHFGYDIALVLLSKHLMFTDRVVKIALYPNKLPDNTSIELEFTGWRRRTANQTLSPTLQMQKTKSISLAECANIYNYNHMHPSQLCTISKNGGACYGDAGSPLVMRNETDIMLVGVASYAVPCGLGWPDGFARISYLYDWIMDSIKYNTPSK